MQYEQWSPRKESNPVKARKTRRRIIGTVVALGAMGVVAGALSGGSNTTDKKSTEAKPKAHATAQARVKVPQHHVQAAAKTSPKPTHTHSASPKSTHKPKPKPKKKHHHHSHATVISGVKHYMREMAGPSTSDPSDPMDFTTKDITGYSFHDGVLTVKTDLYPKDSNKTHAEGGINLLKAMGGGNYSADINHAAKKIDEIDLQLSNHLTAEAAAPGDMTAQELDNVFEVA
ncbi:MULTISPECIES: hypothetical protein [unclassified Streptomyces]|uniref:hypothetical protein n=1 Tax=unclassified Streptomyces TaxID=2593676 RepID=UPI00278BD4D6|nr:MULTISPECIES: hypothetical protein [unclassified Streptomyces]